MGQEFMVLCCCTCAVYQVHQARVLALAKKSPRWQCKLCGQKQSQTMVYGWGAGKECRVMVQQLNMNKGQAQMHKEAHLLDRYHAGHDEHGDSRGEEDTEEGYGWPGRDVGQINNRADKSRLWTDYADASEGSDVDDNDALAQCMRRQQEVAREDAGRRKRPRTGRGGEENHPRSAKSNPRSQHGMPTGYQSIVAQNTQPQTGYHGAGEKPNNRAVQNTTSYTGKNASSAGQFKQNRLLNQPTLANPVLESSKGGGMGTEAQNEKLGLAQKHTPMPKYGYSSSQAYRAPLHPSSGNLNPPNFGISVTEKPKVPQNNNTQSVAETCADDFFDLGDGDWDVLNDVDDHGEFAKDPTNVLTPTGTSIGVSTGASNGPVANVVCGKNEQSHFNDNKISCGLVGHMEVKNKGVGVGAGAGAVGLTKTSLWAEYADEGSSEDSESGF